MPTFSTSPLCPHIENGSGEGWLASLPVMPQAVKVFSTSEARLLKARFPGIVTVVRRFVGNQDSYLAEGEAGGRRFVAEIGDLRGVDILEGVNEVSGFDDEHAAMRLDAFSLGHIAACEDRGVRASVWALAVGNTLETIIRRLATSAQRAGQGPAGGHYLGYHGYAPAVVRDVAGEAAGTAQYHGYTAAEVKAADEFLVSRGPLKLEPLLRAAGVTAPMRWLHTEAGFDGCNTPILNGGWRSLLGRRLRDGFVVDMAHMRTQHELYARRMREIGVGLAFLFTFYGTAQWVEYEYTTVPAMMEWYKQHLAANVGVPPPPPFPRTVYALGVGTPPGVNLRAAPRMTALDIADVPRGTPLEVTEERDGFYRVTAWVAKSVTSATPPL